MRVLLLGPTGTAGRAAASALGKAGHEVFPLGRADVPDLSDAAALAAAVAAATPQAVVSCLASRTGAPADAWSIDHDAHQVVLDAARRAGATHFVLVSALCVQRPRLAFQHAKLAFEASLAGSGLTYSIVRPTAFFKSLSGQVARVQQGKPFLVFGDGRLTACKPISDRDLGAFVATCLADPDRQNRILPIGGPGPALTPLDQVAILSELLGRKVPVRRVPVAVMRAIIAGLSLAGTASSGARDKACLARIGLYYGTESMLVWDEATSRYSAEATPEVGSDTLRDHYARLLAGKVTVDLGAHGVF